MTVAQRLFRYTYTLTRRANNQKTRYGKSSTARRPRNSPLTSPIAKQRFGLPDDFVPRQQRFGRSILLSENIYRLPDGTEFVPCHPTGTLGRMHHLYALVTPEQYGRGERGSVYVRTDGRIFNYRVYQPDSEKDLFDTGFTMHDLERTGRYAVRHFRDENPRSIEKRAARRKFSNNGR